MSVPDRSSIVQRIDERYPHLLRSNTHQADAEFLQRVLLSMPEEWGFISKSDGENGYTFSNGVRVSHDAIFHRASGWQVDIIAAAGTGSPASPAWGPIDPALHRPGNTFVSVGAVPPLGSDPVDPPPPPPPPSCRFDVSEVLGMLRTLQSQQIVMLNEIAAISREQRVQAQLTDRAATHAAQAKQFSEDGRKALDNGLGVTLDVELRTVFGPVRGTATGTARG